MKKITYEKDEENIEENCNVGLATDKLKLILIYFV